MYYGTQEGFFISCINFYYNYSLTDISFCFDHRNIRIWAIVLLLLALYRKYEKRENRELYNG